MNFREFEETLCRLPAVDAVRVVGDSERVTEVHVLSGPEKSPKQVVRDVQSLAMARFGASIDRRVISVVQIAPEDRPPGVGGERAKIVGIRESPEGNRSTVTVTLEWQGEQHTGTSSGPAASSARLRLVGEATLRALEQAHTGLPPMALDAIGAPAVGMRNVVVAVVVSAAPDGSDDVTVGSSLAADEHTEAAVRAVLDSMNRRIPQLQR